MNKAFHNVSFTRHSTSHSSDRIKYSTMLKQHQQPQNNEGSASPSSSCLYCITKAVHPRLGRGETYICGYKPYRCEICNYSTTTKGNLAIHQQSDKHLNNLQEHEQTVSQTIFSSVDIRSNHTGSPDYNRYQQEQQQHNLNQNRHHLNLTSKKSYSLSDLKFLASHSLSEIKGMKTLQQNIKLSHKNIDSVQNRNEEHETLDNTETNKTIRNLYELGLSNNEDMIQQFNYPSPSISSFLPNSFPMHHDVTLNTLMPSTSSNDSLTSNLTETSNHPLACQVCCTFTTDNLDMLIEHAERNRTPFNLDYVTNLISVHINGFWFCKLCSYKSPLKANFQLHCKTEKHAQRLSFLVHVCEGGLWNQSRILSALNIQESKMLTINNNNSTKYPSLNGLNHSTSLTNALSNLTTHNTISNSCGNVSSNGNDNNNNARNNFSLTSSIQLYCIACDLFTTSVHKFRLHCQTVSHAAAVEVFIHLVGRRNHLWHTLTSLSLFYVDLLKSLMDENHTDRGDKIQTNCSSSSPVSQDMNKSNFQAKFSKVLVQLSLILTNIQVIYVCHKKHLSLKLSTPIYSSSSSSSSTNFNLLSDESCQKYISRFKSLTSALSHWHAREHQKSIIKQQICAEHDNSQTQQQHNKSSESIHQSDETFDVCWQLGDAEGTIEELPTTITKLLTPLIDYSMNKFSIQHNILMNGCTTDNPESVNLIHCNDGDTSSSNAKSILSIDNDDRDHDMQPTKVEMPEVIPNQHSKFKNENQHYPTFDELKQQLNNEELKLSINQNNGQSNGIQRVSQLFKFTTNPPSSNITPATDISEGVHMPIVSNITTSTWNVYNIGEPLEEVGQKYDMKISIEVERCHSENNKLSVEQRLPENWLDIGKPKSKTLNESDTLTTMVTAATANSIVSDWPTRPKSEPILKLTNQFTTESEIDTNKTNIHKVKALQNLTDPTKNHQEMKDIMTANAFLSSNRAIEENVSNSCLFMPKDLRLTDEWKKLVKTSATSNAQHVSSNMSLPVRNFGLCGASITPMELFTQITSHYRHISDNSTYAPSMGLLLSSPALSIEASSGAISKTSGSGLSSFPPPQLSYPASQISTHTSSGLAAKQHISLIHSSSNQFTISVDEFFHEINVIPNLHSVLKQPLEIILYDNTSDLIKQGHLPESLLAFALECIVNHRSKHESVYEKFNNLWFKLDHLHHLQIQKGNSCTFCFQNGKSDNPNNSDNNSMDDNRGTSHRFVLESSMELHVKLEHSQSSTGDYSTPLISTSASELVDKLNVLISNSTFSNLFLSCLEDNDRTTSHYKKTPNDILHSLLETSKHFTPESFKDPKMHTDMSGTELNDTSSPLSFATEQKFLTNNYSTVGTTNRDISGVCESNISLSSSITSSDQINLLNKDLKNSLTNDSIKIISNNVYFDKSNLLSNYTANGTNNITDNHNGDIDSKIHLPLAEALLSSIKDYNLNNSTSILHKLYLKAQEEQHRLIQQHRQQHYNQQTSSSASQKRSRTRLSEKQLSILRSYFDISNSPSDEKIREICAKTGLQEKVVKHWFRNTLFKERQKNKDNPYNFSIPPSTSLNLEEYEKTGRIEVLSTMSSKHNHKEQEEQQFYSDNEQCNEQINDDSHYESCSQDPLTSSGYTALHNHSNTHISNFSHSRNIDETYSDSNIVNDYTKYENRNKESLSSPTKPANSATKRLYDVESASFINADKTKWDIHRKRVRLHKDIQQTNINNEIPVSLLPNEESDMNHSYKRNLHSATSTENTDGDFQSFIMADNSNNSHGSPPSITSESSPSISDAPLSPRLPFIPDLDNPQSVIAALIRLGNHNQIQQQHTTYECGNKLGNPWEFPYFSSVAASRLPSNNDIYTDTNKLQHHIAALMSGSIGTSMSNFQSSSESNEAPLDLSSKTTPPAVMSSTDDTIRKTNLPYYEQLTHTSDNEVNNDCDVISQDHFISIPSLIQSEHASGVYHSTSTTSSTNGGRRNRTSITALQSRCMHSIYNHHKTPSVHECDRLGEIIGLSRRVVQVWFQNQRAKEKKMARVSSGQFGFSVNPSTSSVADKLSPNDASTMDSNYCQICSVSIQKSEISSNSGFVNQQVTNVGSQSANFASHASFVDHLFSPLHLKKLIRWCTMDTS